MGKKITITLSILLGLSVLFNLLAIFATASIDEEWAYDYTLMELQWCEYSNELISYSNEILVELKYYEPLYDEVDELEESFCWN